MTRRGFFNKFGVLLGAASLSPTIFIPRFEPVKWKVMAPAGLGIDIYTDIMTKRELQRVMVERLVWKFNNNQTMNLPKIECHASQPKFDALERRYFTLHFTEDEPSKLFQ